MRILLLNDGATPVGGAELQTLRTRELLRAAGHEVRLLAARAGELGAAGHEVRLLAARAGELGAASAADVACFGTTHPKLRVLNQTVNPSAAWTLRRELASFRPDVVHIRMYLGQLSPAILPLLRDVPTVWQAVFYKAICPRGTKLLPDGTRCTVHAGRACLRHRCVTPQSWALDMVQQRLWRRWAGSIDAVVALSETMRTRLEDAGVDVHHVVPNGVRDRAARPALTGPPTVAYAGRLVPEKGVDVLLHAFARVTVPEARLLVVGTGPERSVLEGLARELGIAERTEFLGHVGRDEVEHRLDSAWVQAVPGRWEEPLGNVTLEAMMRGTAVVVTDLGGPAEVTVHGHTGLIVAPDEPAPLSEALTTLLADRARCEELGAHGRARALTHYSEDLAVARLEEVYAAIATPRPTTTGRPLR